MATVKEIRRARLWEILEAVTAKELAARIEKTAAPKSDGSPRTVSPEYIRQLKSGASNIGDKTARNIEAAMELPVGWMDKPGAHLPVGKGASGATKDAGVTQKQEPMATATPQSRTARMLELFSALPPDMQDDALNLLEKTLNDYRSARANLKVGAREVGEDVFGARLPVPPKPVRSGGPH